MVRPIFEEDHIPPWSWFPSSIYSFSLLACKGRGSLALDHHLRSFGMPPLLPLHLSYLWWPSSSTFWLACMQVHYVLVKKVALLAWYHDVAHGLSPCWEICLVSLLWDLSHIELLSPNHSPAFKVSEGSLRMSSKSSIFFTSKELISFTRIFNREYIVLSFSSSSSWSY